METQRFTLPGVYLKVEEILDILKNESDEDIWMDITTVSAYSSMSKSSIRRAISHGELKANKIRGEWLIKKSRLEKYLSS